jgi:hypothetical protein
MRNRVPIRVRARTRARIGGATARNGPRRIEDRPSASAAVARRRPIAAHTPDNVVTAAVFHEAMFAPNTVAELNACEPNHTRFTPTETVRSVSADTCELTNTRAHREHKRLDAHVGTYVGAGPTSVIRYSL